MLAKFAASQLARAFCGRANQWESSHRGLAPISTLKVAVTAARNQRKEIQSGWTEKNSD